MAAIKFKSALGVDRSCEEGFGGIDRTSHLKSSDRCHRLENLEPKADGSLKTRPGYRQEFEYSGTLRASFNSADKLYTLIGDSLVLTDVSLKTSQILATLPSESGDAEIFCFNGDVYVHDGNYLYHYDGDSLTAVEGYAPLYGVNWDPDSRGEIYEAINLLSDRIRISYAVTGSTNSFNLGVNVSSVDRLELNGKQYSLEALEVQINSEDSSVLDTVNISGSANIVFWLTLAPESSQKNRLQKATRAFVFGNNGGDRLCLYHPGLSEHLLCALPIGTSSHSASIRSAAGALPLYIPSTSYLCIGSGASPVSGMAQHYGRALLFTDTDTWCVDWEGEENSTDRIFPEVFLLNSAIGSEPIKGTAYCENDPITYFCGGLWRWHSQSGVRDECSASLISDEVASLLPKNSDGISMLSLPQRQKLLFADADDTEGKLLVYDTAKKAWTLYSGIFAESLLRFGDHPAFSRGGSVYVFSDDLAEDIEDEESFPIKSCLTSHFIDFGCPERTKRSARLLLNCDLSGGEAAVSLENELGETRTVKLKGRPDGGAELFSERIALPRFKKLRYTIESENPITLYSAILSAK